MAHLVRVAHPACAAHLAGFAHVAGVYIGSRWLSKRPLPMLRPGCYSCARALPHTFSIWGCMGVAATE
eukprot:3692542-Pyramimonas_sp.AAC.1